MAAETSTAILDSAERLARRRGYNGFSFRDLAREVEIKSASVHYHFPTKADLGAAVARRYSEDFMTALGDPDDPAVAPVDLLARYVAAFRRALVQDREMCLCGMLGAEIDSLPEEVTGEVRSFFDRNIQWLTAVLSRQVTDAQSDAQSLERQALSILALLEGALLVARTSNRDEIFERIAETVPLLAQLDPQGMRKISM